MYNTISPQASQVMPLQWAHNSFFGAGYYNATTDKAKCTAGSSLKFGYEAQGIIAQPELSCFIQQPNTEDAIGYPALQIGKSLTSADLTSWNATKSSRLYRYVTGARYSDEGKPDPIANPYSDETMQQSKMHGLL